MKFISTRLPSAPLSFEDVVLKGLADDGGLYVPEFMPKFSTKDLEKMRKMNYEELFFEVTRHFVSDEINQADYKEIIAKSYKNFGHEAIAPLKQLGENEFLLELFHGPTLAFKDFALQFLGNLLDYFLKRNGQEIVIIGATSGDTGSAAIEGCKHCDNAQIFILHPNNKVSDIQRKQMTCVIADNVFNLAVEGNFDDCQAMVKKMFSDQSFLKGKKMVAVNSINFARIMAQIVYYFYSGLRLGADENKEISYSVPSGNFGDIYAGFLAKNMGLNIKKLIIATNSNDILVRFLKDNDYKKENMFDTITPSMNIQISSNFERLLYDFHKRQNIQNKMAGLMDDFAQNNSLKVEDSILDAIQKEFDAYKADDKITKATVKEQFEKTGEVLDPHSAIGVYAAKEYIKTPAYNNEIVVTMATAHPAKFPESVSDACGQDPKLPNFLKDLPNKKEKFEVIKDDFETIKEYISSNI